MKHLKTYEGLFSFLKRKPKEVAKDEEFVISDDIYQSVSDILQDVDLMGLGVNTIMTDGKRKIYSAIDRVNTAGNTGNSIHSSYYNVLKDYDLDEMCHILTRLVDYVRSESENQLNVDIDFIENGPHSQGGYRISNPTEAKIHNQLSTFYGNLAYDWKALLIRIR